MAWGPGSARQSDPFSAAERDVKAMVSASWWPSAPAQQRQHAIAGRVLVLPDGTQWLFGAWARWYRKHPSDAQWYLCPPPYSTAVRHSGRTAQSSSPLPPHVVPAGPDFTASSPSALPFVEADLSGLTARVRATVESAAALSASDHPRPEDKAPRWLTEFAPHVPVTVAATWGVMLWCAAAPVFDAQLDDQLLSLWDPYRATPLPRLDGPRWLTPPPLEEIVALYAERLRAHRVDAAVVVLRTMWATASALREEERFTARADALLAVLGATLSDPTMDYGALPYGDTAVVQQWLTRCPPNLTPALRSETSAGDHFRHAFYDLSEALVKAAGEPGAVTFVEPRLIAAALLAADLSVIRHDVIDQVVPWLDPEIRYTVQAMISQDGHPLRRRFWPAENRLPDQFRASSAHAHLLAAMYALDLSWCRLGGGIPARPRGFPSAIAILAELIGADRAVATTPKPVTQRPAAEGQQPWTPPTPPAQPWNAQQPAPAQQPWGAQQPAQSQPQPPAAQPAAAQQPWGAQQPAQGRPQGPEAQPAAGQQPWGAQPGGPGQPVEGQPWGAQQPSAPAQPWGAQPQPGPEDAAGRQPAPESQPAAGQPWGGQQPAPGQPQGPEVQPAAGQQAWSVQPGPGVQPGGQAWNAQLGAEPQAGVEQPGVQGQFGAEGVAGQQSDPRRPAVQRGPTADELGQQVGKVFGKAWGRARQLGGRLLGGGVEDDPQHTGPIRFGQPDGPSQPPVPAPTGEHPLPRPQAAPSHGTRIMSETMVGNFLDFAPLPAQPVNDIEPPPDRSSAPTVTRAGITFMYGPEDDATTFLDALPASATGATQATPRPTPGGGQATMLDRPLGDTLVHGRAATPAQPPFNPQATRIQGNQDAQATQDIPLGQDAQSTQEVPGIFNTDATNPDQAATSPPFDPHATLLDPSASEALAQAASGSRPPTDPRPQGVPPTPGAQDPRAQAGGGQNAPDPRAQGQSPADQYGQGVDPSARGAQDPRAQAGGQNAADPRGQGQSPADQYGQGADPTARGGREPQGVAGAGFDPHATLLDSGALGGQGAGDPRGQEPRGVQPGGFDAQATMMDASVDPFATALDGRGMPATMVDGGGAGVAPSVLLVGGAHTGQRRLARMIALIVGDGRLQVSDSEELRGLALERLATLFDPGGATVMIERLDAAVLDAADPKVFLRTLRTVRGRARTAMVATCDPRAFRRLAQDYPELEGTFRVFRMPEIRDVEQRATLLRVLADERRASLDTVAWEVAREDFGRLRGPGDLTAARLVEAYLERAVQRALGRGAGARERLVLEAEDLSGIAESIEPSLRSAGDVDGYLRTLNQMIGMAEVKAEVERLAAEPEPVNYVFEGPPGTGKATVAGIIGGILGALGTLPSGHVIQCRPVHLIGRDALETELRVAGMVQQADGGVLLVQEAGKLTPEVVSELFRGLREQQLMLVLAGTDLGGFLRANPDIQATFQRLGFVPPSDRELVQLFAQLAENKLYALDEELRVELMTRIAREREGQGFAYARTIREWFEETIARQARRLAGIQGADAMTVARLTSRDLPESNLDRILGELHQTRRADPGGGGA